jgi:hypothetical protein
MISHQQTLSFIATLNYGSPGRDQQDNPGRSHEEPHTNKFNPVESKSSVDD